MPAVAHEAQQRALGLAFMSGSCGAPLSSPGVCVIAHNWRLAFSNWLACTSWRHHRAVNSTPRADIMKDSRLGLSPKRRRRPATDEAIADCRDRLRLASDHLVLARCLCLNNAARRHRGAAAAALVRGRPGDSRRPGGGMRERPDNRALPGRWRRAASRRACPSIFRLIGLVNRHHRIGEASCAAIGIDDARTPAAYRRRGSHDVVDIARACGLGDSAEVDITDIGIQDRGIFIGSSLTCSSAIDCMRRLLESLGGSRRISKPVRGAVGRGQ